MSDRKSAEVQRFARNGQEVERYGYKPDGQRGYQPQSSKPLDPLKLTPPSGGSAIQSAQTGTSQPKK